ncbi:hypothetical protein J2S09_001529 [Bacillus fengqiuensis]|nr:hypothetical protein [Bacillus fengqiuensis]
MAFKLSAVFMMAVVLLANCGSTKQQGITIQSIEKQVLLFSNDDNARAEELYYDALLDLRTEFPEELKNVQIIHQSTVLINDDLIELHSYPALLLVENNEIVAKIEGTVSKQDITEQLKQTLSADKGYTVQ